MLLFVAELLSDGERKHVVECLGGVDGAVFHIGWKLGDERGKLLVSVVNGDEGRGG